MKMFLKLFLKIASLEISGKSLYPLSCFIPLCCAHEKLRPLRCPIFPAEIRYVDRTPETSKIFIYYWLSNSRLWSIVQGTASVIQC